MEYPYSFDVKIDLPDAAEVDFAELWKDPNENREEDDESDSWEEEEQPLLTPRQAFKLYSLRTLTLITKSSGLCSPHSFHLVHDLFSVNKNGGESSLSVSGVSLHGWYRCLLVGTRMSIMDCACRRASDAHALYQPPSHIACRKLPVHCSFRQHMLAE